MVASWRINSKAALVSARTDACMLAAGKVVAMHVTSLAQAVAYS